MKRILLLIVFFVGLIPNLKEMCMESVYEVKGQTFYFEYEDDTFPHCGICSDPDLIEANYENDVVYYCANCQFYCETCHQAFDKSVSGENQHEAIHPKDEDNNENEESPANKYYICLSCLNSPIFTEDGKNIHIDKYGHKYFKEVQP